MIKHQNQSSSGGEADSTESGKKSGKIQRINS